MDNLNPPEEKDELADLTKSYSIVEDGCTCCWKDTVDPEETEGPEEEQDTKVFDQLGIGVSIYFKILKAMTYLMLVCTIASAPLYYFYSKGTVSEMASGNIDKILSSFTLGNIGESSVRCLKDNIRY